MAKLRRFKGQMGFSLVELLVALVFTGILMAGLASVFKGSTRLFTTSGEVLSSSRRNRMAIDLLTEDLNSAGMFITDLANPPTGLTLANPAFYILPNVAVTGAGTDDPSTADQLFFYRDEPLPFEGLLQTGTGSGGTPSARSAAELVLAAAAPQVSDSTYQVDCQDPAYAKQLASLLDSKNNPQPVSVVFKDAWQTFGVKKDPTVNGKVVTIVLDSNPDAAVTGIGALDAIAKAKHIATSGVIFFRPAQMVRYSIKMKMLDPLRPGGVPCLVRDQGAYDGSSFTPVDSQESIITENVSGFKIYLSADAGKNWAGLNKPAYKGSDGWTKIRADVDAQVASTGRSDVTTTSGNESWFRDIPTLVRVDLTTRTAAKRSEYSITPASTTAFRNVTQSLVIVPRHFGLPIK